MLLALALAPLTDRPNDGAQSAEEEQPQRIPVLQSTGKTPTSIETPSPMSRADDSMFDAANKKVSPLLQIVSPAPFCFAWTYVFFRLLRSPPNIKMKLKPWPRLRLRQRATKPMLRGEMQ